jgi:hypothetical protein
MCPGSFFSTWPNSSPRRGSRTRPRAASPHEDRKDSLLPARSLPGHELRYDNVVEEHLGAARRGVDEEADAIELTPTERVLGSNNRPGGSPRALGPSARRARRRTRLAASSPPRANGRRRPPPLTTRAFTVVLRFACVLARCDVLDRRRETRPSHSPSRKSKTKTGWKAWLHVLAHELGHPLAGHAENPPDGAQRAAPLVRLLDS